jgi:hypothetical protein
MKRSIIGFAVALTLGGCSSLNPFQQSKPVTVEQPKEYQTAIKDTRLSVDFPDNGVKVYYTIGGKLEKVEITGVAEAWKQQHAVLAEMDAMGKMVKFVYGKDVATNSNVKTMARAIERSKDNVVNEFKSQNGRLTGVGDNDSLPIDRDNQDQRSNTATRVASIVNETLTNTVDSITSKGRLTGVHKIKEFSKNDGKLYVAVYEWSVENQKAADQIRGMMNYKK